MATKFNIDNVYLGVNHKEGNIFLGFGELREDGRIKFLKKSNDRTVEVINAVGRFMRNKIGKSKGYFGYDLPVGKLLLVRPGYDFDVFKTYKKRNRITKPVDI